jgi:hypothetical protein
MHAMPSPLTNSTMSVLANYVLLNVSAFYSRYSAQ